MLCIRPFRFKGGEFGCGQCMPCRVNRRRMWTARIVLESYCHQHCSFITLTYADVPRGHHGPPAPYVVSLQKKHLQDFFKRLRIESPVRLRYFAVGEYGEMSGRAHFHAAVFGLPSTSQDIVARVWGYGSVLVGTLNKESAQYVAGYVCKKMTCKEDYRLRGRAPEFAVMSRKPGIGAIATNAIAASWDAAGALSVEGDVPAVVRINGALMPVGQYLRRMLRLKLGMEKNMPQGKREELAMMFEVEDSALRERKRENTYLSVQARLKIGSLARSL